MSLELSPLKKKTLILSQSGRSKPQTSNPGSLEGSCPGRELAPGSGHRRGRTEAARFGPPQSRGWRGEPSREPLVCGGPLGGLGVGRHLLRGTCLPEGSHRCPRMPQSAFQNSIFRVCGEAHPWLTRWERRECCVWAGTHRPRRTGEPPPAGLGAGGETAGLLPAREPSPRRPTPPTLCWPPPTAAQTRTETAPSSTFLSPFRSRNSDIAVWWLGGVRLATNCLVKIMLGCQSLRPYCVAKFSVGGLVCAASVTPHGNAAGRSVFQIGKTEAPRGGRHLAGGGRASLGLMGSLYLAPRYL